MNGLTHEEMLSTLGSSSLEFRRLRGDPIETYEPEGALQAGCWDTFSAEGNLEPGSCWFKMRWERPFLKGCESLEFLGSTPTEAE